MKRVLALLLTVCMVFSMLPQAAFASETPQIPAKMETIRIEPQVNPLYAQVLDAEDLVFPETAVPDVGTMADAVYVTEAEAAVQIREYMKDRTASFTVYFCSASEDYNALFRSLLDQAMVHTGVPEEGDFLRFQYGGSKGEISYSTDSSGYNYSFTYNVSYYTTAEQETEMDAAVDALLAELAVTGLNDYEKVCAVYDYICANIVYDYDNLEDSSYMLKYTGYAALVNKTAVCQGYAVLLYRLLLELGVDARVISGTGNGGGHAWNILALDDLYYNADSTWDASWHQSGLEYNYFLRNEENFTEGGTDHIRDAEFSTAEFLTAYPMGETDYVPKTITVVAEGTCGEALTWVLTDDGVLTISGTGEMDGSASVPECAPWYEHRARITSVVIEDGVTSIGHYAFNDCTALTSVTIPSSVAAIGQGAFNECTGLLQLELPSGLTEIPRNALFMCESLTELKIPETVETIGIGAFWGCTGLTKLTLPEGLKEIGSSAFGNCDNLTAMTIPEGITEIPWQLFADCYRLEGVTFPTTVTVIKEGTFLSCPALKEFVIPGGVVAIPAQMFMNCYTLSSVTIPDSVTQIGAEAFKDTGKLTALELPDGLETIGDQAFVDCAVTKLLIPASVSSIGAKAFYSSAMDEITFQGDAPAIEENAFEGLTVTASYPANNTTWTADVLQNYGGTITWVAYDPNAVASGTCGDNLTWKLTNDGTLTISGQGDMYDFESGTAPWYAHREVITAVVLEDGITRIGSYAFESTAITALTVPATIISIGSEVFANTTALQEVRFVGDAPAIAEDAFTYLFFTAWYPYGNETWTEEVLTTYGGNLTWEPYCLDGGNPCDDGKHVPGTDNLGNQSGQCKWCEVPCRTSGDTIWAIETDGTMRVYGAGEMYAHDQNWVAYADQVTALVVEEGVAGIIHCFTDFVNLKTITLGDTVTGIENQCFSGCVNLEQVKFPASLNYMGSNAFRGCVKLTEVHLPAALQSTGSGIFSCCPNLTGIWVDETNPYLTSDEFGVLYSKDMTSLIQAPGQLAGEYRIAETVTDLGTAAFEGCTLVIGVEIPDGIAFIFNNTFKDCTSLKSITIPASVGEIGFAAFENCTALETITFLGDAPTIGENSFGNVSAIAYYPENNPTWTTDVMDNYGGSIGWSSYKDPDGEIASGTCGTDLTWVLTGDGTLTISGEGISMDSGSSGAPWYDYRADITKVILPETLLYLGDSAFQDCMNLKEIELPDELYSIPGDAFYNCMSLKEITFPETLSMIGWNAFYNSAIEKITITGHMFGTVFDGSFQGVTATVYYPGNDTTWHELNRQNYGGELTWVPYDNPVALVEEGTCGENLTWSLTSDGILTISGTGAMTNYQKIQVSAYGYSFDAPWLHHSTEIGKIIVEDGVTSIGSYAFPIQSYLYEVQLPESVTYIGEYAFYCDNQLTKINLPDGVTEISNGTFYECRSLNNIEIPTGVTKIGYQAFYYCSKLAGMDIPDSVTTIGTSAFYGCAMLTEIVLPESLESLGTGAFYGCSGLQSINIPSGILRIGSDLFRSCSGLTSVELHDAIEEIGRYAFYGCGNLTNIQMPFGVSNIMEYAFAYSGLTEVTFTGSMPGYFGSNAFTNVTAVIRYPANKDSWVADRMQNYGGTLTWESYELPLVEIASGTCGDNLTWVLTNDGKLTISGEGAMHEFEGISAPWYGCRASITEVEMESGITSIGSFAFDGCSGLTAVTIPAGVTDIGNHAFFGCSGLISISIPDSVISIGSCAFTNCLRLAAVTIPDGVTFLGDYAFGSCESLTSVTIPDGVTEISGGLFSLCSSLTSVSLGNRVTTIGEEAFYYCGSLTSITLPDSVTVIGRNAFGNCIKLTSVTLGSGITTIGECAFQACEQLADIEIPAGVTTIGGSAFGICSNLTSVTIPASVTSIGGSAFWYCTNLSEIIFEGNAPTFGEGVFYGDTTTAYYPADNDTWTADVMQQYDGTITWVPYGDPVTIVAAPVVKVGNVASSGKIKLTWNAVDGAAKYKVYRSTDKENWTLLKTTTGTSLTNTAITAGELYYYYVVAVAEDGTESEPSGIISRCCDLPCPVVTLSNVASSGKIKISWKAIEGAVKYQLYRSTNNEDWTLLKTTTGTSLTNTSTTAGELYYYKVKAIASNSAANSAFSAVKSRTCDLPCPEVTLSNVASTGKIKISWNAIEGAVKYQLYRSTNNEDWTLLKTTTGTSLTNTSTTAGELYYYKVKAIASNSAANSAFSTVKSRTCDLPCPVVTLSNVASTGKIKISWKAIEGAVKYQLYRSTDNENWTLLKTTTGTSLTNTSTTAGELYYYKVKAIASNSAANSAFSAVKSRTCDLARPTLSVTLNSKDKPYLTWTQVSGAVKYQVYRSTDGENWTLLKTTTGTSLTNTSTTAGELYYYKVRAIASTSAANSAYSAVKSVTAG